MNEIHEHNLANAANADVFKPNLKGIMVGNGVTNWKYDTEPAYLEMGYWHSLYDTKTYLEMKKDKCDYSGLVFDKEISTECSDLYDRFAKDTQWINIYDIFGTCWGADEQKEKMRMYGAHEKGLQVVGGEIKSYKKSATYKDYTPWAFHSKKQSALKKVMASENSEDNLSELPPCTFGEPVIEYLNRKDVRAALHVPTHVQAWDMCTDKIDYTIQERGSQWVWEKLKGQYRMLKFSGDTDGAVPTEGTLAWINSMDRDILEAWRPYMVNGQVGGFVEEYDGLTLGTVHGAGHMCPQFKPAQTYHLIFNWLKGKKI
jgi:hypothetical protein